MTRLISVVVPCFNQGAYLPDALASLAQQTHRHFEAIIVDDGSTDPETLRVLDRVAAEGIHVLHGANAGLASARNRGVAAAEGEYLHFLDADDFLAPEMLERSLRALDEDASAAASIADFRFCDEHRSREYVMPAARPTITDDPVEDFLYRWERGLCVPIHSALFRRSAFGSRPPFPEGLRGKEDWVMWVRLALAGCRFRYVDQVLAYYRLHTSNMTGSPEAMLVSYAEAAIMIAVELPASELPRFRHSVSHRVRSHFLPACLHERTKTARRYRWADGLANLAHGIRRLPRLFSIRRDRGPK